MASKSQTIWFIASVYLKHYCYYLKFEMRKVEITDYYWKLIDVLFEVIK